jgi:hypothetical protein
LDPAVVFVSDLLEVLDFVWLVALVFGCFDVV